MSDNTVSQSTSQDEYGSVLEDFCRALAELRSMAVWFNDQPLEYRSKHFNRVSVAMQAQDFKLQALRDRLIELKTEGAK